MRAGQLRHRVTIQARIDVQDSTGSMVANYVDWLERWASIEPLTGREYFAAAQVQTSVTTQIRLRYVEGITPKMRVRHAFDNESPTQYTYYEIESVVSPREAQRETVLMCRKLDAEGWHG